MGNSCSPLPHCPGSVAPLERTLQRHRKVSAQHGSGQLPVLSLSDWRRNERQGSPPSVGEVFAPHWTATARLKLGSPQPIRCCPAPAYLPHWVRGE